MRSELRFRQVHLDFHTSEHIPEVGAGFDSKQFVAALKEANVDSVTLFARDHHGWCFYPSRIGKPHPQLKRPDLLGEMVNACRANDINAPIYLTVQWDERMAREHPEWRVMEAANQAVWPDRNDSSAMNQLTATWHTLCLSNEEYLDYVEALALEVMELYKPDGLFFDILLQWECVCPKCLARMRKLGLDPDKSADRLRNGREVVLDYYRRMSEAVWAKDPEMRIFHNSGHIYRGQRERYKWFSHLEIESLPTGGWGYDHFLLSARYAGTLGLEYLGMTGKFHTMWGEFGGFKRPVALDYECATVAAFGGRCSIGDQLHPSGIVDAATYKTIGPAYARIKKIEPYLVGARAVSEMAIISGEAHAAQIRGELAGSLERHNESDYGAARMLLESQLMFDVVDLDEKLDRYRLLILPDTIVFDDNLATRLGAFLEKGGKLILSGASGMTLDESRFALPLPFDCRGGRSDYLPDYIEPLLPLDPDLVEAPFVVYERAHRVRGSKGSEVLAGTRVPYFNRTWEHFSSHQHTPYTLERNRDYDAALQAGSLIYFSHPIFKAYYRSGQPLLKYLLRGALNRLLPDRALTVKMPSSGRVSLMEQPDHERLLLHLLFAQTQLRGAGLPYPDGRMLQLEILEDAVPIHDVDCTLRLPHRPRRVSSAYTGRPLDFRYEEGCLTFTVPTVSIHELIVIER